MFNGLFLPIRTVMGSLKHSRGDSLLATVAGLNDAPFFLAAGAGWDEHRVFSLLRKHNIPCWGWGSALGEHYFRVPKARRHYVLAVLRAYQAPVR